MPSPIVISILANASQANATFGRTGGILGKLGSGIKKMAIPVAAVGAAVGLAAKEAVSAASDAQQSLGATETVFGHYADKVVADSKRAAREVGLSGNAYRENANLIGSLFKNQGVSADQLAGKTKSMIKTAADLAATFGGPTSTAVDALGSAFKGEFDPLEKYGISIKQSAINAELAAKGQSHLKGAALKAAQQQATTNLIMRQSKDSLGAFGKESGTLAHQQQVLGAQFDNIKVKVGNYLLPILTTLAKFANDKLIPSLSKLGPVFRKISAFVQPIIDKIREFAKGGDDASGRMTKLRENVAKVWASIQQIFASAVSIVTSLWALFGARLTKYTATALASIIQVISGAFTVIAGIFNTVAALLRGDWSGVWDGIKQIVSGVLKIIAGLVRAGLNVVKTVFALAGTAIKAVFKGAWNAITTAAANGISALISKVKAIPDKIISGLGNVADLLRDAGKAIISGLIGGITDKLGDLYGKVAGIGGKIKSLKGPLSYDKVMLKPEGAAIIEGLIAGIASQEDALYGRVQQISRNLASTSFSLGDTAGLDAKGKALMIGSAPLRRSDRLQINFNGPVIGGTKAEIGRWVKEAIKEYDRNGGRGR